MHNVKIVMKDGTEYCSPMWEWRPAEGWFSIVDMAEEATGPRILYLDEMQSAITEDGRRHRDAAVVFPSDSCLLTRALEQGWVPKSQKHVYAQLTLVGNFLVKTGICTQETKDAAYNFMEELKGLGVEISRVEKDPEGGLGLYAFDEACTRHVRIGVHDDGTRTVILRDTVEPKTTYLEVSQLSSIPGFLAQRPSAGGPPQENLTK